MGERREAVRFVAVDDYTPPLARMSVATRAFRREVDSLNKTSLPQTSRATGDLGRSFDVVAVSAEAGGNAIDRYSGRLGLATRAATLLAPALTGIGASAIPALTGVANLLGVATVATGSSVIAFQGLGGALEALNKAQLEPTAENIAEANRQLRDLSPEAVRFATHLHDMIPAFKEVRDSSAEGLFPGLDVSLNNLDRMIPRVSEFVREYADVAGDIAASTTDSLGSGRWSEFADFLEAEARPTLTRLASTVGDLAHGLSELWIAFDPLNDDVSAGLERMADRFDDWASGLDQTDGFRDFMDYVRENGPEILETAGAVADAVLQIGEASSGLTGSVLEGIEGFFDAIAAIADSPIGPALFTYAAAASAAALATRGWSAAASSGFAGTLRTGVSNLQTLGGQLRTVRGDLATVTSGWMTAGAASERQAARMNAAAGRLRGTFSNLGTTAGIIGGLAFATSGVADSMGLANTATFALTGAMIGGPMGAVAGGLVGAFVDAQGASDDLESALNNLRSTARTSGVAVADVAAASTTVLEQLNATREAMIKGDEDPGNVWAGEFEGITEAIQNIEDAWDNAWGNPTDMEANTAQIRAQQDELSQLTTILQGVAQANNDYINAGTGVDAQKFGFEIPDAANVGFLGNLGDMDRVLQRITPVLQQMGLTVDDLMQMDGSEAAATIEEINEALAGTNSGRAQLDALSLSMQALDGNLLSTADAAASYESAMSALLDPKINLSEQTDAWIESIRHLTDDLSENSTTLRGNSDAALQNRAAIRDRVTQLKDTLVAQAAAGASSEDLAKSLRQQRSSLINAGLAAGMSGREVRKYIRQLGLTPRLVRTSFKEAGIQVVSKNVQRLRGDFRSLPKDVRIRIREQGLPKTKEDVRELVKDLDLTKRERRALIRLQESGVKKKVTDINDLLERVDKNDPEPKVTVDNDQANSAIRSTQSMLNDLNGNVAHTYIITHKSTRTEKAAGGLVDAGVHTYARGGLHQPLAFADGGYGENGRYYPRVPQIVPGGADILWGERETGWEAYISGKPSELARNREIWAEAGRRLGTLTQAAAGALHEVRLPVAATATAAAAGATVRHVLDVRVSGEMDLSRAKAQLAGVVRDISRDEIDQNDTWQRMRARIGG